MSRQHRTWSIRLSILFIFINVDFRPTITPVKLYHFVLLVHWNVQLIYFFCPFLACLVATHWMIMMLELTEVIILKSSVIDISSMYLNKMLSKPINRITPSVFIKLREKEKRLLDVIDVKESKFERGLCTDERCRESSRSKILVLVKYQKSFLSITHQLCTTHVRRNMYFLLRLTKRHSLWLRLKKHKISELLV